LAGHNTFDKAAQALPGAKAPIYISWPVSDKRLPMMSNGDLK
jgi:hypothetical protein